MPITTSQINSLRLGGSTIQRVYRGSTLVFGPPPGEIHVIQAESANTITQFTVVNDGAAQGGQYCQAAVASGGVLSFNVNVTAGTYELKAMVNWPNHQSNSFKISVNGGADVDWNDATTTTGWEERIFGDIELNEGSNVIAIKSREAGAAIDFFTITKFQSGQTDPLNVTGGDGTVGVLEGHTTSNAVLPVDTANGYSLFQSNTTNGIVIDNTISHPHSGRTNVYRFRWEVGDAQIGGGNRSELGRMIGPGGGGHFLESSGTFYYAYALYAESGKFPDPQTWRILAQHHNSGGYSPPVSINLTSSGNLQFVSNQLNGAQRWNDTVQFSRDEWVFLVWKVTWSQNGRVDFWRKRQVQDSSFVHVGGANRDTTGGLNVEFKHGIYTEDIANADLEVRGTNVVRGTGFASVVKECSNLNVVGQ